MLVELSVSNYRSYAEESRLSLVAYSRDQVHPGNRFRVSEDDDLELVKSAVLYGANASGKSNIIQAAWVLRYMVVDAYRDLGPEDPIPVEPFALDPARAEEPTVLEVIFIVEGVRYEYGFAATPSRVVEEWLNAFPKGREQRWFHRQGEEKDDWYFGPHLKGQKVRIAELTRPNALFLAVATHLGHEQLSAVARWFRHQFRVIGEFAVPVVPPKPSEKRRYVSMLEFTARKCLEDEAFRARVEDLLRAADVGIEGLSVVEEDISPDDLPEALPPGLRQALTREPQLRVRTLHTDANGTQRYFDLLTQESAGTKAFFEFAGPWLDTMMSSYVVLIDELFANLHPALTRALIDGSQTTEGELRPQIVFTTHDATLLDSNLFRRDQIWFAEKDSVQGSHLYSLLDFKARKNEAFGRGYLTGRYGARPFVGDLAP
ncbi:MAG: AAA family ATPase [Myxococcota bacterium]